MHQLDAEVKQTLECQRGFFGNWDKTFLNELFPVSRHATKSTFIR